MKDEDPKDFLGVAEYEEPLEHNYDGSFSTFLLMCLLVLVVAVALGFV